MAWIKWIAATAACSACLVALSCASNEATPADTDGATSGPPAAGSSSGEVCEVQPTVIVRLSAADGSQVLKAIRYTVDGVTGSNSTCMLGVCYVWDGAGAAIHVEADDTSCVVALDTVGGGDTSCGPPSATIELVFGECGIYDSGDDGESTDPGSPSGDGSGTGPGTGSSSGPGTGSSTGTGDGSESGSGSSSGD